MSLEDGVLRAVFVADNGLYYRESEDGLTWTPPERISEIGSDAFVGFAGRPIVVYTAYAGVGQTDVRSRYRNP
jgi:hypothetical protein